MEVLAKQQLVRTCLTVVKSDAAHGREVHMVCCSTHCCCTRTLDKPADGRVARPLAVAKLSSNHNHTHTHTLSTLPRQTEGAPAHTVLEGGSF
jgi:hypothetical protein